MRTRTDDQFHYERELAFRLDVARAMAQPMFAVHDTVWVKSRDEAGTVTDVLPNRQYRVWVDSMHTCREFLFPESDLMTW